MRKKLKLATFFQDPRLFTHDPRLLASPQNKAQKGARRERKA